MSRTYGGTRCTSTPLVGGYQGAGQSVHDLAPVCHHSQDCAATLAIRAERDFWSRGEDVEVLGQHLVHASKIRTVAIPEATP
jgi:hypothetical protein